MLRCLGFYSFTNSVRDYDEHYNMLLEYAEMSLHDFFRNFDPPQLAEEIYSQWKAFCQIAKGIETLHGFDYEGAKWLGYVGVLRSNLISLTLGPKMAWRYQAPKLTTRGQRMEACRLWLRCLPPELPKQNTTSKVDRAY